MTLDTHRLTVPPSAPQHLDRIARHIPSRRRTASTQLLSQRGFHCIGIVIDPDDGTVWRWERGR